MSPVMYPPFELQADRDALTGLLEGVAGYKVEAVAGRVGGLWLRDREGRDWLVAVDQRDLRFKFEVFALGMMSIEQMRERWRNWKAPTIPPDMPEPFRSLMATRPPEPVAPVAYDDWPLEADRVEVLRRAEFIVEDVDVGPTFGGNPNAQSAAAPGQVPHEASASCVVAVGLLFSCQSGRRLLIAADWMPMDLIVTQEARKINEFIAACERVELRRYMESMRHA
jgi:hypothetical protein